MTNAQLAELLNIEAGLAARDAVTADVIRQWVAWGVLPKAKATASAIGSNPAWSRDERGNRRARRLAELRKANVRRETAVIAQAYFEWGHSDFERVRAAIASEHRRGRAKILKPLTTDMGFPNYGSVRSVATRAIQNQSGPLDDRFRGTQFEQSPEFYALALQLATRGDGDRTRVARLTADAFDRMVPGVSPHIEPIQFEAVANSVTGLLGTEDEIGNSAEATIKLASFRQFRIARYITGRVRRMLRLTQSVRDIAGLGAGGRELMEMLASLGPQISIGPWAIGTFTQVLQAVARNEKLPLELRANCQI